MPQSVEEKTTRFKKIFPPRVEKLIDGLRLLGNCTNKSNYEWNKDLVKRAWIEIAKQFEAAAKLYDVKFEVKIDGEWCQTVDTSEPLS